MSFPSTSPPISTSLISQHFLLPSALRSLGLVTSYLMDPQYDWQLVNSENRLMDPQAISQPYQAGSSITVDSAVAGGDEIIRIREEKKRVRREKDIERSRQYRAKEKENKALLVQQNAMLWNQLNQQAEDYSIVIGMLQQEILQLKEQIRAKDMVIEFQEGFKSL